MKYFAVFKESGIPAGFYIEGINSEIPSGVVEISEDQWREFQENQGQRIWAAGTVLPYNPPTPALTLADYSLAIQSHLDDVAKQRQYDGIQTAVSYRDDPNPQFASEAEALFIWRSDVWTYSTTELDKVQAGQREAPAVAAFLAELPTFSWPD